MKSLITGIGGFIGSTLAERLLYEGVDVVGIDCFTPYYERSAKHRNLANIREKIEFFEQDIVTADLDKLLEGVDTVYHQAGQPGVRKSWGNSFADYTKDNVDGTQKLLEAATRSNDLQKFVYASSSSVYGDAERYPTDENDRPMPRSPYGVTKLAAEHLCSLYASNFGLPTVSLRYFTVYGPKQRPDMAFNKFCTAALTGHPIVVFGDGKQIRDFTFVDDIVSANVLAARSKVSPGSVYNVAGGTSIDVNSVLEIIETLAGRKLSVERTAAVPGDVSRTGGNRELITKELGWRPSVEIETGLAKQFLWHEQTLLKKDTK